MSIPARGGTLGLRLFLLLLSIVAPAVVLYWCWLATRASSDPDRYYHLMLAREWASSSGLFPQKLPSVDALGWSDFFPDKEPLFHVLTGFLQRWGGEGAVLLLPAILVLVLIGVLARLIQSHAGGRSFRPAIFLATLGVFLEPWLFRRLSMLRPHGLAIVLFFILLHQLRRESRWGVLIVSAAFALSYHAVYLPLILPVAAVLFERHPKHWKLLGAGVLGLLVGSLGSPSFPGNVIMGWRHLQIALFEAPGGSLNFGMELYPWATNQFLLHHLGTFVALSLGVRELVLNPSFAKSHRLILVLCGIFFVLSMQSPRAQEYLLPLVIVLSGSLFVQWIGVRQRRASLMILAASLVASALLTGGAKPWRLPTSSAQSPEQNRLFEILKGLPEAHPRIFNVEWDASPQVLYALPDARVVDLLDPSFLAQHDRELHEARLAIAQGRMVDVFGFLVHRWQADYLLTRNESLRKRLEQDPHFERIHPRSLREGWGEIALYRLNREVRRNFVSFDGRIRGAAGLPVERFGLLDPKSSGFQLLSSESVSAPERPLYHDLSKRFSQERSLDEAGARTMRCAVAHLPADELRRLQGRTILAIGGGRNVRIWRNGRPLYHSIQMPAEPLMSSQLVDLREPATASDRFELMVCSLETSPVMGMSISFWSEAELNALCERKRWSPPETLDDRRDWKVVGRPRFSCIGDFAMPALQTR
jgi:hypothetical protein